MYGINIRQSTRSLTGQLATRLQAHINQGLRTAVALTTASLVGKREGGPNVPLDPSSHLCSQNPTPTPSQENFSLFSFVSVFRLRCARADTLSIASCCSSLSCSNCKGKGRPQTSWRSRIDLQYFLKQNISLFPFPHPCAVRQISN